jgi:hypothetical protein
MQGHLSPAFKMKYPDPGLKQEIGSSRGEKPVTK